MKDELDERLRVLARTLRRMIGYGSHEVSEIFRID